MLKGPISVVPPFHSRGAFLGHGSVTNPERTYHLEISTDHSHAAAKVLATLHSLILMGIVQRKGA